MKITERIEITPSHLNKIRLNFSNSKMFSDEELINAIFGWERMHRDDGARTLLSALCFPTFNDYLYFKINELNPSASNRK